MIEKTVTGIKEGLASAKQSIKSEVPVDFVIAGGTSIAKGFAEIFSETLRQVTLNIPVGEIIHPADPLYSVAKGSLIAAENAG